MVALTCADALTAIADGKTLFLIGRNDFHQGCFAQRCVVLRHALQQVVDVAPALRIQLYAGGLRLMA
jgi:hypothetical protein